MNNIKRAGRWICWSPDEIAILRQHYQAEGIKGMQDRMPGRSQSSIYNKVSELGLSVKAECTTHELHVIKARYRHGGARGCLALLPGRTDRAIQAIAARHGIKSNRHRRWTENEMAMLERLYKQGTKTEIIAFRLNRTQDGTMRKARLMGLVHNSKAAQTRKANRGTP